MNFEEIEKKVIQWAVARDLLEHTTTTKQYEKLKEEFEELGEALVASDRKGTIDSIGDMLVVLTLIASLYKVDLFTCYAAAYLEIKDRRGKMVNGIFVKE